MSDKTSIDREAELFLKAMVMADKVHLVPVPASDRGVAPQFNEQVARNTRTLKHTLNAIKACLNQMTPNQ